MSKSLQSLIETGSKIWVDSIDPQLVAENYQKGATGATSNPIIISNLIKTGRFDEQIQKLKKSGLSAHDIAWQMTDQFVSDAEQVFAPVFERTAGDDGYVSFELDPLLEDLSVGPSHTTRVAKYVELAKKWAEGRSNRLIKVPATPAGIAALEDIVAAGINVNVTLIFSIDQYRRSRDAVWQGAKKRPKLDTFKSVFSIFVSRLDVYAQKHAPDLSPSQQGLVGILNAKRVWQENCAFWRENPTPLAQEMIFASTGTKNPDDPKWKYVAAFAGSDIETNPPETNAAVEQSGKIFSKAIDRMPEQTDISAIDAAINWQDLEKTLMEEGLAKFADPQKQLITLIEDLE